MFDLSQLAEPIVQAPMAGGPSTPQLAIAVCEAGGLGFLAAGYRKPEDVRQEIEAVRAGTGRPFGVNLFVPSSEPAEPGRLHGYLRELEAEAQRHGVAVGDPRYEDDGWEQKLQLACEAQVAVTSFTFGCPPKEVVERLHGAGVAVWVTVTSAEEATQAQQAGADALVVQGSEAGGHRGGFTDDDESTATGLLALLRLVARRVSRPLVATGGIADGAGVAAVLCAGASAAQVGTALMLAPEAATNEAQRAILADPAPTRLTRAFTGRLARGIVNRFIVEHTESAPRAYPEIHHATSPIRAAARSRGDAEAFNLWAGEAHELAQAIPAGEIVRRMAADAQAALERGVQLLGDPPR